MVLHHAGRFAFILRADGTVSAHSPDSVRTIPELSCPRTLYLFNPDDKNTQAHECAAFAVIASNLYVNHFSGHVKHIGVSLLLLPPWAKEELVAAHRALQSDGVLSKEQVAIIEQRYDEVGGSIRYSLYDRNAYAVHVLDQILCAAKSRTRFSSLRMWFDVVHNGEVGSTLTTPHLLFHLFPSDDNVPGVASVGFASAKSAEIILETISVDSSDEWKQFVTLMRYVDPKHPCLREKYGMYIHAYMRNYSKLPACTVFELSQREGERRASGTGTGTALTEVPEYKRSKKPNDDVAYALSSRQCTYVVPLNASDALFDSFYVSGDTVYCFQLRCSTEDRGDSNDYKKMIDRIRQLSGEAESLIFKFCRVMGDTGTRSNSRRALCASESGEDGCSCVKKLFSQFGRGAGPTFVAYDLKAIDVRRNKRVRRDTRSAQAHRHDN